MKYFFADIVSQISDLIVLIIRRRRNLGDFIHDFNY